jgi:hypothetical protein
MLKVNGDALSWEPDIVDTNGRSVGTEQLDVSSGDAGHTVSTFIKLVHAAKGDAHASVGKAAEDVNRSIDSLVTDLRGMRSTHDVGALQGPLMKAVNLSKQLQLALVSLRKD